MPAILHFSNSAGLLLDQLAATVGRRDPFTAPRIATPTPGLRRMVQMGLSERWGAAAHIDFLMLEHALWDCLARLDAYRLTPERQPARLLDTQTLQALIFAELLNAPPAVVAEYLTQINLQNLQAKTPASAWRKALQLASKLAQLFREYEYSRVNEHDRQGLAQLWLHGKPCFAQYLDRTAPPTLRDRVAALEAWQGELYRRIFGLGGLRDRLGEATGQYLYTLPQYQEMVFAQDWQGSEQQVGASQGEGSVLHLFGLAQISPFHRSLIRKLSDQDATGGRPTQFHIFALNPCAEYWEDAVDPRIQHRRLQPSLLRQEKFTNWRHLTEAEKSRMQLRHDALWQESLTSLEQDNALLARWGMVGRENIQLWCQVTDYAFAGRFREPESNTLLASLQQSVLQRRGPLDATERVVQDDSLRLIAAPEMHREIEALQEDMWRRLQADATLRPDDIAIALVDSQAYAPVIDMVLGARQANEAGYIPYAFPEAMGLGSDLYLRGLQTLMQMAAGIWDRPALLALLENPRVQAAMGMDQAAAEKWVALTDSLNLYAVEGLTFGNDPDPHAFSTGMDRLLLGLWMEAPGNSEDTSFKGYLPRNYPEIDAEDLAKGIAWMRRIQIAFAPFAQAKPKPMKAWAEDFIALADAAMLPDPAAAGEARLRRNLQELAFAWQWRDLAMSTAAAGPGEANCPKSLFLESLRETLARADMGGQPWLSGGVQVASLESLRGLPFRVIYVPGLQEGDFPDERLQNSLDLRQFRRVIGDLEPASGNRYALLMALMQATDAAILSHVDRDLERNQERQPSSVWNDLIRTLENDHLAYSEGKPTRFRITRVSLDGEGKPSHMKVSHPWPEKAKPTGFNPIEWSSAELGTPLFTGLDLDALHYFLKDPAGQNLKWSTGLSRRSEEIPEPHEPYTLAPGMLRQAGFDILAEIACAASAQGLQAAAIQRIETRLRRLQLNGDFPPGRFGELALEKARHALKLWFSTLADGLAEYWGDAEARALLGLRFGPAWPQEPRLPRLDLAAQTFQGIALTGYRSFVFNCRDGGVGLLMPQYGSTSPSWKDLLPAFVFAVLSARDPSRFGERFCSAPLKVFFIPSPQPDKLVKLQPYRVTVDADLANSWLQAVWPYVLRKPGSPLPPSLNAWEDWADLDPARVPWNQGIEIREDFRRQVRQRQEMARFQSTAKFSPLQEIATLMPPPPADDALAWAQNVFGPLLASIEKGL